MTTATANINVNTKTAVSEIQRLEQALMRFIKSLKMFGSVASQASGRFSTWTKVIPVASGRLSAFGSKVSSVNRQVTKTGQVSKTAANNVNRLGTAAEKAGHKAKQTSGALGGMAKWMGRIASGVMLANVVYRMRDAFDQAIQTGTEFSFIIRRIQVSLGDGAGSADEYREAIVSAAEGTLFSLNEVAEASRVLAMSGIDVRNSQEMLSAGLSMGTLGAMGLEDAMVRLVQITNAYGIDTNNASHIADIFARTADLTTAEIEDLAHGMEFLAADAAMFGMSLDETTAILGQLSTTMGSSGMAGRSLRQVIRQLVDPTDQAAQEMARYGILQDMQANNYTSLIDIVNMFNQRLSHLSDRQRQTALTTMFGTRAGSGFAQMMLLQQRAADDTTGTLLSLEEMMLDLAESEGYASDSQERLADTWKGAMKAMENAAQDLANVFVEEIEPAVVDFLHFITEFLQDEDIKSGIKWITEGFKGWLEVIKEIVFWLDILFGKYVEIAKAMGDFQQQAQQQAATRMTEPQQEEYERRWELFRRYMSFAYMLNPLAHFAFQPMYPEEEDTTDSGMQSGGIVRRSGRYKLHAGEEVIRSNEIRSQQQDINITITVEGSGDVSGLDADALGDVLLANLSRTHFVGKDYGG